MNSIVIIGTPIKIHNLEIAEFDFPNEMTWDEGVKACIELGEGWILPSKKELNILFKNKDSIGGFNSLDYWNLEEGVNKDLAWYQNFFEGKKIATFKYLKCRIRAIKIIIK